MSQNIVEKLREESVKRLFNLSKFKKVWPKWQNCIHSITGSPVTENQIFNLGDHLKEIFSSTKDDVDKSTDVDEEQSKNASSGAIWEALVCWYVNICNIGRRTVCIKPNKDLLPQPIKNSLAVSYGNFLSNSESDLIAITFPEKSEYVIDKNDISICDEYGRSINLIVRDKYNYLQVLKALVARDFSNTEIHVIQCKTNWKDNAQTPMLWDLIYSSKIDNANITIGQEGFNIKYAKKFTYAFATIPTNKVGELKETSTQVLRVRNLSGGVFWGLPSKNGIAQSIKEMLNRNLSNGSSKPHFETIKENIPKLQKGGDYSYFDFPF